MKLIPVLDIKNARVVLAKAGNRDEYQPVKTALCRDPSPAAVIEKFLGIFPFDTFYIADLDAIEGKPSNCGLIESLSLQFNQLKFLVDSGQPAQFKQPFENIQTVLGTESYYDLDQLTETLQHYRKSQVILSFDYKQGELLGCPRIEQQPKLWTERLIILDITAVGTDQGFNFDLLSRFTANSSEPEIIIGGGIRSFTQMQTAASLGVSHILVASCLHHQLISPSQIQKLSEVSS